MKQLISIVAPVYNEQENITEFYTKVVTAITPLLTRYNFEIILIDDGSRDQSWHLLQKLSVESPYVRGLKLSRNFGHQIALSAGYDHAQGAAIISIDSDLQDPPELIPELITAWEQGAYVVYARRIVRIDNWMKKFTAALFYRFLERTAHIKIPRNVGDFRLIDKKILNVLQRSKEQSRFLRGMVAWCGYPHVFVDFQRGARLHGVSGYSWGKMFSLALDGLIGFSNNLVKVPALIGALAFSCTFILMGLMVFGFTNTISSFTPLFITTAIAIQSLCFWILLEYLNRMYEIARNRPLYLIERDSKTETHFMSHSIQKHEESHVET